MRTLGLNKTTLWYCEVTGSTEEVDTDGNYTGVTLPTYSAPVEIKIALYPASGRIVEQIFGKEAYLDMVAVSTELNFKVGTLFYLTLPTANFGDVYDYSLMDKQVSKTVFNYGLKRRS